MKATLRDELLNVPNLLTLLRIAGIPVVMLLIWRGEPIDCVLAGWVYSAATITDFLDGWLARRMGLVTAMGKFLDPLADKLIVMAMLCMLVALHRVPAWLVVIILAREMTINGLRAIASAEGLVISAGQGGKLKTALQMMGVLCLVIHYPQDVLLFGIWDIRFDFNVIGFWILVISMYYATTSAVQYFGDFFAKLDQKRREA